MLHSHTPIARTAPTQGRARLPDYANETGFLAEGDSPDSDVDGHSVFNRERVAAHQTTMAARQRAGIGPAYGDDGHWINDHLHGPEKTHAEAHADRAWARTHRYCPHSTQMVENPVGRLTIYRCPDCGQDVGLDAAGKVLPHSVRITEEPPR